MKQLILKNGWLAQLAEQRTLNPWVQGSNPWPPINMKIALQVGGAFFMQKNKVERLKTAFYLLLFILIFLYMFIRPIHCNKQSNINYNNKWQHYWP